MSFFVEKTKALIIKYFKKCNFWFMDFYGTKTPTGGEGRTQDWHPAANLGSTWSPVFYWN